MKVLCISTDYPPHGSGGYEQQCRDTVDAMRGDGHQVLVLSGELAGVAPDEPDGVRRELPRFPAEPQRLAADAARREERRAGAALRRSLAELRPDVVCVWRLGELAMSLPARAAAADVPVVGVVCDPWMLYGPRRDPWSRLRGGARWPAAARWLFVSQALRREVAGAGLPVAGSDVVAAGVDLAAFPLAPLKPWSGRLLYAGRLSPLKGVDLAIRAMALLPPGVTLDIAGSGAAEYERLLRELAERLGVAARVRFRGTLTRRGLADAYAGSDAVLFPVRWAEPFGLVPLEAMACGTPVIAVASGGAEAYLRDGDTALPVPADDPAAIAAAVNRLAADPAVRERLRIGGRRAAERHPADASQAAIQAVLEDAARCRPPAGESGQLPSRARSSALPCSAPLRLSPWARRKKSASSESPPRSASWM